MQTKDHWENVYTHKPATDVSWFQVHAEQSLRLIQGTGVQASAAIIDVGGGASTLVDDLLQHAFTSVTVLDLSASALAASQARLGAQANKVQWLVGDITKLALPQHAFDVWHDRAVFHFLTNKADREAYVNCVLRSLKPGGHVIMATFASDGPLQCSGLPVMRYEPDALHAEFGAPFVLLSHEREDHHTPFGSVQKFVYCYCRKQLS
ncbi:class I SAM-dependent methyltransferase [Rhodoferax sp.]|uniref:class I SAM-dependent methyltransferase n=1 Tax=Rhodoferax sp. TaxID=50421 RepID=UPI00261C03D4|nr:class I SAM-dependent methyltransferase [Rhodoferax sp.]MDD5479880.1 class I SAM-dependent methyltransferase [Rhodoferax sp.]